MNDTPLAHEAAKTLTSDRVDMRGQIEKQLAGLEDDVARVDHLLKSLVTKLQPVCVSYGLDPVAASDATPEMSLVARSVDDQRGKLAEIAWVLEDLYNRIEL